MPHEYQSLAHGQEHYKNFFVINWTFFNVCNYSCSYCVPTLYNGSQKGVHFFQALRFINRVIKAKPDKSVFFEFTGGEITYYKHFPELIAFIKERGGHVGIISNGSRPISWWQEQRKHIDHACLSFHAERGDKEHFFKVLTTLHNHTTLHVNIMMLPEKFDELYALASRIAAEVEGISVSIQPLFKEFLGDIYPYSDEQMALLKHPDLPYGQNITSPMTEERKVYRGGMKKVYADGREEDVDTTLLISKAENSWEGWECMAGVENLCVSPQGFISKGLCKVGGIIGNIRDPNFSFPEEPEICPRSRCTCAFDIMCTKKKLD